MLVTHFSAFLCMCINARLVTVHFDTIINLIASTISTKNRLTKFKSLTTFRL